MTHKNEELILAIERLEIKKTNIQYWIDHYGQKFPDLIPKSRHDIEICERAIARLQARITCPTAGR